MLALVDGEPRLLGLKRALVTTSNTAAKSSTAARIDLAKAEPRAHILEGLLSALDELDE